MEAEQLKEEEEKAPGKEEQDQAVIVESNPSKGILQNEWNIDKSDYSSRESCNDTSILEETTDQAAINQKECEANEINKLSELKDRSQNSNNYLQMSIFDKNAKNDRLQRSQIRSRNQSISPTRNRSQIQHPESSLLRQNDELNSSLFMPKSNIQQETTNPTPMLFCQQSSCEQSDKEFLIRITGYQKIVGGFKPFIKYTIETQVRDNYSTMNYLVKRRFTEFKRLKTYLHITYFACIQPPFPDSSVAESFIPLMQLFQSDMDMITSRSSKLEIYLQNLGIHELIKNDPYFELFLSQQEEFQEIGTQQTQIQRHQTITSYYSPLKGIISGLQYFFNIPGKAMFFSDQDRTLGKSLFQHATYFSDIEEQLINLRQIYSNNDFDKLSEELKKGENTVQSPEGFIYGFQEIYLQNDALFHFFKFYQVKQESDRIELGIMKLNEILNMLQQAKEAFQRFCERKEIFLATMEDQLNNQTLKFKETLATDQINNERSLNGNSLQQEDDLKQNELSGMEQSKEKQIMNNNQDSKRHTLHQNKNTHNNENLQQNIIEEEDDKRIICLDDEGGESDCSTDDYYQDKLTIEKNILETQQKELLRQFKEIKDVSLPKSLEEFAGKAISLAATRYQQDSYFYECCKSQIKDY